MEKITEHTYGPHTYHAFKGRKEIRPPHYGLILLQKYLGKYRY